MGAVRQVMQKTCPRCREAKETAKFGKSVNRKDGLQVYCKTCRMKYQIDNAEHIKDYNEHWRKKNRNDVNLYRRQYNAMHREQRLKVRRQKILELKLDAFNAYGGATCSCCGEKEFIFLTIDHVDGGGTKHRKTLGKDGNAIYRWLKKQGYPSGYRVLCRNCNWGVYAGNGICPHKIKNV